MYIWIGHTFCTLQQPENCTLMYGWSVTFSTLQRAWEGLHPHFSFILEWAFGADRCNLSSLPLCKTKTYTYIWYNNNDIFYKDDKTPLTYPEEKREFWVPVWDMLWAALTNFNQWHDDVPQHWQWLVDLPSFLLKNKPHFKRKELLSNWTLISCQ